MAASSSSPSSGVHCKYDVFLSFRGEDTRKNFVCHLYRALEQKAIHTFIDSEELEKGNQISELLNAVAESSISVVVLSQNYASSTWCLKELVKIMECKDKKQQIVVPIFYEVDPSDIRKLKKEFGKAFAKHEENPNLDKEILETWKTAVKGITDLSGWDSRQYKDDIELIEKIIGDIFEKRSHIPGPSSLANNLVGMDHHIEEVSLRLCRGKNDVGVVGIWGMGGIGKTTIARAAYDKIAHQFEHKCFFYNVKERFPKKDEAQMRGELLSMILNEQSVDIFNQGSNAMLERLGKKKVLVVLDDVETFSQIEALLGNFYSFGVGSRILVTTRDKESLAGVYETYEPRCLKPNESLELFMKHAFRNNQPSKEYSDLSKRAIEYAQGLPLALKVLGGSLYNKSIPQWEELLEKIKKIPERKIMDVLRTSLEGLDDQEKNIFLDITCLFRGWNTDFVTEILDSCGFYPRNGLRVLVDRALITYRFWMLDMHDLLQEMGREIVRLESTIEPGKRSRLWSYEDVNRVLTQNTATDAVECLVLDLWDSKVDLCINTGAFVRMTKLRLLIIYYSFDTIFDYKDFDDEDYYDCGDICPVDGCKQLSRGDFEFLSQELRLLLWHGCPLESLPSTFIPKNLVQLDMRASHIRELWEGIKPLQNLKAIKLSHCQYLVKIPDLSEAVNLEKLLLDGCSSLFEVHSSISALQNVHLLDLNRCKKLKILPSCIHMKSLWTLKLSGCSNLEKFPEIADVMTELEELYLNETAVKELPSSIDQLLAIKKLTMRNCESLEFLPDSICNLANLTHLDLTGCTELKTLSTSIHMPSLRTLNLNGCSNLEKFPEISGTMKELPELCLDGTAIKELPASIDQLLGIKKLSMRNCESLEFLPDSICNLANLTHLDLTGCTELKTLSTSIHMPSLRTLNLNGCSNLEKFPEIADVMTELEELYLNETAVKELPSSIDQLLAIKKLSMQNCESLEFLPDSICNLANLTHLDLTGCTELKSLSTSIHMPSLRTLNLNGCSNLEKFPEISGTMKELPELCLDGTAIKELPASIDQLLGVKKLSMRNCESLEFLPDSVCNLANLTHLDLTGCTELKTLSASIHMPSLRTLNLHGCSNLEKFPEISGTMKELPELCLDGTAIKGLPSLIDLLEGLNKLSMRNCESLEFLPDSICNLANLTHLDLSGCSLPEKLGDLISLTYLEVLGSGIKHFPFSVLMRKKLEPFSSSLTRYYSFSCLVHLDLSDCNLLEFSDAIAHLSSLNTLKLCRNNLESLPVTLNQLGCLTHLELEACKRLKSIPELSSSINCIDAHDCTALETVSTPKTRKFDFRFSNCVRLVQANLFRDIVETHSLDQDNHLRPLCFNMCLPGSEIPEWFNLRDMGCSVTFHVPVNSFNNKLLGIAVCIVINFSGARHDVSNICGRCHWTSKGNHGGHFFKFDVLGRQLRTHRFLESDHLFMVYLPWSEYGWIAEDGLDAFKIVVETGTYSPTEDCFTSSCAVRLVYANHEEMQNSVTQPIIHVDSREGEVDGQTMEDAVWQGEGCCAKGGVSRLGAPFFPDQLEIRKSKTELEAESLESGERTGTCQTLELLLAPQTDSKDEEEIMVVAEQGEACRAHLCCCLSLSGCTMSLRNRNKGAISDELGSHSGLVVPNTQSEGEEERVEGGFNNGRGIIDWKRIARVTMQLLLLAGCSIALKQTTLVRMKGKKSS